MDAHPLAATAALWHDRVTMETGHARAIAERLHLGDREEDGTPVIRHVERVATMVPEEARAVAWLHEVLEWTAVTEQELLMAGLTGDELRALRLLNRKADSHSDRRYFAHLDLIARAAGGSGRLARIVKSADLRDRSLHPRVRRDGWSPPYAQAMKLLSEALDDPLPAGIVGQDTASAPISARARRSQGRDGPRGRAATPGSRAPRAFGAASTLGQTRQAIDRAEKAAAEASDRIDGAGARSRRRAQSGEVPARAEAVAASAQGYVSAIAGVVNADSIADGVAMPKKDIESSVHRVPGGHSRRVSQRSAR